MRTRKPAAIAAVLAIAVTFVTAAPAAAADVAVEVVNFEYVPNPIQVDPGDTITFTNNDPGPHTATADDGSFSVLLEPGESKTVTIAEAGEIPFFCKLHGGPGGEGMSGVIQSGPPPEPERFTAAGADNTAVAISWSRQTFADDSSGFALLGRADLFADALASGVGQGKLDAPLLLTASNALDPRTKAELDRLGVQTVYLMGGPTALSQGVEDALRAAGFGTRRVAGATRIETAIEAARTFVPEARSALISRASGANDPNQGFVDALGAGAVGAATGQAVLFSETAKLSDSTKAYLGANPIDRVTLVGGELALSAQVATDLEAMGITVDRASGDDRYHTARSVSGLMEGEEGPSGIVLVDGTDPDAWADGFAAAGRGQPVLLSSGDDLPLATLDGLVFNDPSSDLACGESAAG
ncbi:MAG: cell wall-binding repeat-containing protein, partial [Acidimicrobiia bacterium]